ncbi:MAG: MgtC/SapB family protein [Lawsonibacter sp.]|nr:MgtC/SapB family protein [Lawsonibacter sp.]
MSAIFIRIMTAMALGGIIGMERGIKNRPAGLRTYTLVCIGSCVVMLVNQYSYQATGTGDPVRMGAQVVSGIGFLGAGTIIVTAHNRIKGLTTAAGLWASACVGLAVGIGLYEVALVSGASIFLVLTLLHRSELGLRRRSNVVEFYVELDPHVPLGSFLRSAKSCGLELNGILKEYDSGYGEDSLAFMVTIRGKKNLHRDEIIQTVRQFEGIRHLEPL